ncbi:circadian clock protein KaiC [Candidatus Magnetomorum sp. HK-1]|nr:circadian clock protein KaiC [Candidatus Magnetomorum sp. HK-1]
MITYDQINKLKPPEKIPVGIEGFDFISQGGLPKGRATLVTGTSGSGKTFFSIELLMRSITQFDRPCVFVTMEEPIEDVVKNVLKLDWDLPKFVKDKKLALIDISYNISEGVEVGNFNLKGLIIQIKYAAEQVNAKVVVIDSIAALFHQYENFRIIRREINSVINELKKIGLTIVITAERLSNYDALSRYGIEEFVVDNVIILRSALENEKVRRTIQILKMRGDVHAHGEFPLIISTNGLKILTLSSIELKQSSSNVRYSSGDKTLDAMTGGGIFKDSIILVNGPTGTGKTLLCANFIQVTCYNNEKAIIFAYEESRDQLIRNALSFGVDFEKWEQKGLLKLICIYPESMSLEEHLLSIRKNIDEFKPKRLVIDSLSALDRIGSDRHFREFVIGLTSYAKKEEVCSIMTSTTPTLAGVNSITEYHISTITDAIILLRYVEVNGSMKRGITIIKMRGSQHEKEIREFEIDNTGIHIGNAFKNMQNIILGVPSGSGVPETERLQQLFEEGRKHA